ncbi:MAG: thioesterase family protein [Pseudomonadota bacterium]
MNFSDLLRGVDTGSETSVYEIPESWAQGRTAYGGLTGAICAREAEKRFPGLPPMRTAQVSFVGPAAGQLVAEAQLLRQGKNTAFVDVTLRGEKGVATRATFVYGAPRESSVRIDNFPCPDVPDINELEPMELTPFHPTFLQNFDLYSAVGGLPFAGNGGHAMAWWGRHKDESARATSIGLLALGDLPPPAAAASMTTFAPVSSVNWHVDLLTEDLSSDDGWFLIYTEAEAAGDGWSGQKMGMWTRDGRAIMSMRQAVVVFS